MKTILLIIALACLSLPAFSQGGCSADATTGGTKCTSPVNIAPQAGKSPTTFLDFTPESVTWPCTTLPVGSTVWRVCAKGTGTTRALYVDFGDGTGFHTMQGPPGPTGAAGATGPQGIQGLKGATGATGATGAAGSQGPQGATGATGTPGLQGAPGPAGAVGPAGANGQNGAPGQAGPQGVKGDPGDPGPSGIMGPVGPMGPMGPAGPAGSAGTGTGAGLPFDATCDIVSYTYDSTGYHARVHCQ